MDRCALFVDAGYLLADGAMAVHGTRNRESVSWDYPGLVRLLNEVAHDRTGLPLLRCYWYESTVDGRRTAEHDGIADIPGVKVRAARIRPGRREGVDNYVQRDITTLARSGVLCEAVLVSGDEDMIPVVADVQDQGVRVSVLQVSGDAESTVAAELRRECDDLIEVGAGHLRPYVNLITAGAEPAREPTGAQPSPLANGRARTGEQAVMRQPVAHPAEPQLEAATTNPGKGGTGITIPTGANAMEQLRAMQQSIAQRRTGGDHLAPQRTGPAMEPPSGEQNGGLPTGAQPSMAQSYQAHPVSPPEQHPAQANPGTGPQETMRLGPQSAPAHPVQSGQGAPPGAPQAGPQGTHAQDPGTGPQTTVRLGPHAYPPPAQQPPGGHRDPGVTAPRGEGPPGAPPGSPPGAPGQHGGEPRFPQGEDPHGGGGAPPNPTYGVSSQAASGFAGAGVPLPHPRPATGPGLRSRHGPATDPTPQVGRGASAGSDLHNAMATARREGEAFGAAIARGAPALWIEAVLARRPTMPSDMEARLLQGSALGVDHLLTEQVRHELREGFWSALERARGV